MKKIKSIKLLELFGGIGAPRKALENIGINVKSIDYVEVFPYAVEVYNRMFDNNYKPQNIIDWNMNVDLLVHGSPCQDFSKAGKNDLSSGRSILYNRTLEIIKDLHPRPKYVLWENVKGLISKRHKNHFNHYLRKMESLGYVNYWSILNSLDFGIPQNRERIFVVSIRKDIPKYFDFEKLEKKPMRSLIEFLDKDPLLSWYNVGDVFKEYTNFYVFPRSDGKLINGAYNRVWKMDKYVGTIPVSNIPKIADIKQNHLLYRYLTPKECWRLMGFTDKDFDKVLLSGVSKNILYLLAGNSIVVPVLEAIFKELFK